MMRMLANVWGLFSHPEEEWNKIKQLPKPDILHYIAYVMVLSLLPAVSWYYGTTRVGWSVGQLTAHFRYHCFFMWLC